jgi:hypothetical protein
MPKPKKRKRKTNKALLVDRLYSSYVERTKPEKAHKKETSHLQSMAALFGDELTALSAGAGECKQHPDQVEGVCPICRKLWPDPAAEARRGAPGGREAGLRRLTSRVGGARGAPPLLVSRLGFRSRNRYD